MGTRRAPRPLRVALATDSADPSGVGRHMLDLAGALDGVDPVLGFPAVGQGRAFARRAEARGLKAQAVHDWADWLRRQEPDLLHVHAGIGWEGHDLVAAGAAAGLRVVRTEHLPWLITDPRQRAEYAGMVADVDAVIAVSGAAAAGWAAALRHMPGPRLGVRPVRNGVARPDVGPDGGSGAGPAPERGNAPTVLCVARFTPQKDHRTLIHAFARLRRDLPAARLLLVGGGPEEGAARAAVRRLGLGGVEFLGPRDDVPALMAAADVLALPSRFEGLPLVVLEAMALGVPVVATRVGGVAEALGPDHPWLVEPGDWRGLAAALRQAISGPRRDGVVARARARWDGGFSVARMAADVARVYRAVAGPAAGGRGPMDTVRLGFVGAGSIAHRHFGVLEHMHDVRVAAVCDPDEGRARHAAERMRCAAFPDHDAMLDGADLDAVFICVPPFAHGAPERACIARALPFFVEKPLSLDLALAEAIAREVEEAGLVTATGYHWRYLDTVDEARAHLAGNPAHLMQGFWIDGTPPPRWWWREDESGGQIVEQATHIIDLARFLAGDVEEVFGLAARRDRPDFEGLDVPTASAVTLRFASGAIANLSTTCLLRWNHRVGLHVFADALAMEITDHDLMVDVGAGRPVRGADGDPVWREDRDFIEAVKGNENRIRAPYGEALTTHRVALAAARSAKTGQIVRMEGLRLNPQPPFRPAPAPGAGAAA